MGAVADVQSYLETQGIIGGSTGWVSSRRRLHDGDGSLDKIVVVTEDGGGTPEFKASSGLGDAAIKRPAVQVMVRGEEWDSDASLAKAQAIFTALHSVTGTIGAGSYLGVHARTSEPIFAGFDERGRPLHTISFVLVKLL
jgi:hypothetical protein